MKWIYNGNTEKYGKLNSLPKRNPRWSVLKTAFLKQNYLTLFITKSQNFSWKLSFPIFISKKHILKKSNFLGEKPMIKNVVLNFLRSLMSSLVDMLRRLANTVHDWTSIYVRIAEWLNFLHSFCFHCIKGNTGISNI